jgi:catechol 2,3-dioxygenase
MTTVESLPATLQLGAVHLNIKDLDRSLAWYQRVLGLELRGRSAQTAELGDSVSTSIVLHALPAATPPRPDQASMFHYCLLYPTREELARAAVRLRDAGAEATNMNDRHTHEAIYLNDPDGNNIELAWDRPREQWPDEPYGRTPVELDLTGLLATITGEPAADTVGDGLLVGHLHFIINDVERAVHYYRDVLGMDLKYHVGDAVYLSVGGYHHHMGARIHTGKVLEPQPSDCIGLHSWTITLANPDEVEATRRRIEDAGHSTEALAGGFATADPWNLTLRVVS